MPIAIQELQRLKQDMNNSTLLTFLFPALHAGLNDLANNPISPEEQAYAVFKQANRYSFRAVAWIYNLFSGDEARIPFFSTTRVLGWLQLDASGLLADEDTLAHFSLVSHHADSLSAVAGLQVLQAAGLLSGPGAQANRDVLSTSRVPNRVASDLALLHASGLLIGERAQIMRDLLSGDVDSGGIVRKIILLGGSDLFRGENTQANFSAMTARRLRYPVSVTQLSLWRPAHQACVVAEHPAIEASVEEGFQP